MIFYITVLVVGAICAAGGFFWGRYEGHKDYEQLRYEAVGFVRSTEVVMDIFYARLAPWYQRKNPKPDTNRILRGYRLLQSHVKEVEL